MQISTTSMMSDRVMKYAGMLMLLCLAWSNDLAQGADRPNILWISCEDISPNLGCYGDRHAITPNLDRLAAEGVRFNRAFTTAGVCAVVRSSIITGMYPPSIGSQHMRSRMIPPSAVKAFPELLRAAGYFCTNRSKTDYQFEPTPSIWDRQGAKHKDWRERPDPDQPFFSVINITVCHESQIRHGEDRHRQVIQEIGAANQHDPDKVVDTMPGYLPDTPAVRKNWAWYHDNITLMDKMAGDVLRKLEEDGLADNTLVVFWSDHGMGMPRGKRWVYDTGTLIPMIMRWPGKLKPESVREDLVSVLDLPPTMLAVAGVEVPDYMHGRVLLGEQAEPEPPYLFFHRDRMDEVVRIAAGCPRSALEVHSQLRAGKNLRPTARLHGPDAGDAGLAAARRGRKTGRRPKELVCGPQADRGAVRHRQRPLGAEQLGRVAPVCRAAGPDAGGDRKLAARNRRHRTGPRSGVDGGDETGR